MPNESLTLAELDRLRKEFTADPTAKLLQNALTTAELKDVALDHDVVMATDTTMSHQLDDWKVTDQKKSGRCWLFAGLNLFRVGAAEKLNVKEFEFSQNHAMFFDKIERANYFLQGIIDTADRPIDDRTVATLLQDCMGDGGQWNMFVAVIKKHGAVPKSAMPETISSEGTLQMNASLRHILRTAARDLREAPAQTRPEIVEETLATVWRALCLHLGTPPERFFWQWTDKDQQFHRDGWLTPQEFQQRYFDVDADELVCLVHDPRPTSSYGKTYTVEFLGNVVGARQVVYLNVEMARMKKLAADMILDGTPVWFGCDVGHQMDRGRGIWDIRLRDLESIYGTKLTLDKAARLDYHQTRMTHAMLLTGVDMVDGSPRKWRVENSWGEEHGDKGFFTMNDSWFDEYVFEVAAPKSLLPAELVAALDEEPTVLPAWDPMGALAR
jgi:bleomycin hydrolase